eukprot:3503448-Pyramimonas_sp.AAC.1
MQSRNPPRSDLLASPFRASAVHMSPCSTLSSRKSAALPACGGQGVPPITQQRKLTSGGVEPAGGQQ